MDGNLSLLLAAVSGGALAIGAAAESALLHYSQNKLEKMLGDEERSQAISRRLKDFDAVLLSVQLFFALASVVFLTSLAVRRHGDGADGGFVTTLVIDFLIYGVVLNGLVRAATARAAERVLVLLLGPIMVVDRLMSVLRVPVDLVGGALGERAGVPTDANDEDEAVEDILDAVAEGEAEGVIEGGAADFIENIMEYKDRIVREVMTPRTAMICVPADVTFEEVISLVNEHGHSKLPLYSEGRDNVVGVVFLKDLVRKRYMPKGERPFAVKDAARRPFFVPETKKVSELLKEFQQQKSQIAIVLDEFGGTSGLVTVEDIIEEIVGELEDEFDTASAREGIRVLDERNFEVDARLTVDEINDLLPIDLPMDGDYETVGGFLSAQLGKVPSEGEQLEISGVSFTVMAADERKVDRVRVTVPEAVSG